MNENNEMSSLIDDLKNGKISMEDLSLYDLIRINKMLKEEGELLDEELEKLS